METTAIPNLENAVWYKVTKDRSVHLVPVFTDQAASTQIGAVLYDKDIVPCKTAMALPSQSPGDPQAWYIDLDIEDIASAQAAGISIPADIATVNSLSEVRAMFNRKQSQVH